MGPRPHTRKCLLITRKIIIPPPDSGDSPEGTLYFAKKCLPLTAGTHQLHLRTQGSASGQKKPKRFAPLTAGTHQLHLCARVVVEARTCRSRGAHVACTRTYNGQCARKKYGHVRKYGRGLERLLAHMYGQGSCTWLGRNGETTSSSCSWGGNGMRRVHREATESVGANRLGRNSRWK